MVEPERLDGVLDADLHLRVGHVGREKASGPCAGDEHVRRHSGRLGRGGVLDAQVVVDRPLLLEAAGCRSRGADGVEDDRWLGRQGGDHAAPFGDVAFLEGLQLGGLRLGESSGDGLDGWERVCGEEGGEDLRAHRSGAAEDRCCRHGGGCVSAGPVGLECDAYRQDVN